METATLPNVNRLPADFALASDRTDRTLVILFANGEVYGDDHDPAKLDEIVEDLRHEVAEGVCDVCRGAILAGEPSSVRQVGPSHYLGHGDYDFDTETLCGECF